jgi:hypothetical protein
MIIEKASDAVCRSAGDHNELLTKHKHALLIKNEAKGYKEDKENSVTLQRSPQHQ